MAHTRDDVLAAIAAGFPKSARPRVLDLLDTYGVNPYEREVARVQLAILTLSEKDEEKLREFTSVAKIDYRDVLFWAEHPGEAKADTPEKRQKVRAMLEKLGLPPPADLLE